MTSDLTAKQRLAELILRESLEDYVSAKRSARPRWSWRLIADTLADDTDGVVRVSGETLRLWYGTEVAA